MIKEQLKLPLREFSYDEVAGMLLERCAHRHDAVRVAVRSLLSVAKDGRRSRAETLGRSDADLAPAELGDIMCG